MKRHKDKFELEILKDELKKILENNSFSESFHKHSISLLNLEITPESHKNFHNNLPYNKKSLEETPYFYEIWKDFSKISEVTCYRIMEKLPNSAYGLHHDRDAGGILRFQIPIHTNDKCWLALTNQKEIEEGWTPNNSYFKKDLEQRFGDNISFYQLEEGFLYRFDTDYIHTLTNEGDTPRYTLLIDVKNTEKVEEFLKDKFIDL